MRELRVTWLLVLVLHAAGALSVASAQTQLGGFNVEGEIEAGGRFFIERPSSKERSKFEEYRDLSPGEFSRD